MRGAAIVLFLLAGCASMLENTPEERAAACLEIPQAPPHECEWGHWGSWKNTGNAGDNGLGNSNQCLWWRVSHCKICRTTRNHMEIGPCDREPGEVPYRPFAEAMERVSDGLTKILRCLPASKPGPVPFFVPPPIPVLVP